LTGLRHSVGGVTQQVNTFIQQAGTFAGVIDILMPDNPAKLSELQSIVNTFNIHADAPMQPSDASSLGYATVSTLDILHVSTWTTPAGVFFITGEVGNYGSTWAETIPVRAVLRTADGLGAAEAVDTVMGYGIPPGGFAPFSLRFGQGQSAITATYQLVLGGEEWKSGESNPIYGQETLKWSDDSSVGADGRLTISGAGENVGVEAVHDVRAVVTVFDTSGNVIAAGFTDVTPLLGQNASVDFQIVAPEIGGTPVNYIVNVQGLP
jgi:hypothetical protein